MADTDNVKIELRGIKKVRDSREVLRGIDLKFYDTKKYIIVGPSGVGKSTLLRLINRMDEPTSGSILYMGTDIRDIPVLELRRKVGIVFQVPVVFEGSVKDNLIVPYLLEKSGITPDDSELKCYLEQSGLEPDILGRKASRLSVGEKQRLNLARALVCSPEVLLLDEPTSALDPQNARRLIESVKELNRELGLTLIMVTHQREHAELLGGDLITLSEGLVKTVRRQ